MICLSGVMGSGLRLSKLPSGRGGKQAALWKSSSFCVFISLDAIEIILHLSLLWRRKKKKTCNLLGETKEQIGEIERERRWSHRRKNQTSMHTDRGRSRREDSIPSIRGLFLKTRITDAEYIFTFLLYLRLC